MSASDARSCRHCGSAILNPLAPAGFCCAGCEQVHGLILSCGLERYYELRSTAIAPVNETILGSHDFDWLREAQKTGDSAGRRTLRLGLRGLSCVGCVWLIEKLLSESPGIVGARVNAHRGTVRLEWRDGADLTEAARRLAGFGYLIVPDDGEDHHEEDGLTTRLGLCAAFAMNAMLNSVPGYLGMKQDEQFAEIFRLLAAFFATLSMLVGGSYFAARAWASLRRGKLHMDLPITLGLVSAYLAAFVGWALRVPSLEYWDFVCLFTFLMLVGRWTQERAIEQNRRRLPASSPSMRPVDIYETADSRAPLRRVPVEALRPGHIYAVPSGQVAPVCGRLLHQEAELSLAWINGESESVLYPVGRLVPSGALNIGQETLRLEATETWGDSMLRRLTEAGGEGAFAPKQLERILSLYLGVVLSLAALAFGLRGALTGDWAHALQAAISILIVSCPCAIGLAFPLATELAVGTLRRAGVYLRDHRVWERTLRVRRVVFDKTGTLTLESPRLANPEQLSGLPEEARRALFALVATNLHPFGRSLREALAQHEVKAAPCGTLRNVAGAGVMLTDEQGVTWTVGKPGWQGSASAPAGMSAAEFCREGTRVALFLFAEQSRAYAKEVIDGLRADGVAIFILSGDRPEKVATLLGQLGLPAGSGLGGLSPEQKADWIRRHDGTTTLMLGDGANDALAFSEATLRGTPVVDLGLLEQKADFYLLGRDLRGLGRLFAVARHRRRVLTEVFLFTVAYNLAAIGLSAAGVMSPLLATVMMPTSAILTLAHVTWRMRKA
jgi:Cu2+-exporting ATPase